MGFESSSPREPVTFEEIQSVATQVLNQTFADISGCSITLTQPGTYRIAYIGRAKVNAVSKFVVYRLFNSTLGTPIVNTEAICSFIVGPATMTDLQASSTMEAFLTINSSTIVVLQANCSAATGGESRSDTIGRNKIIAHRL